MNKKIKICLVFIFTLLFILFIKSDCFAFDYTNNVPSSVIDKASDFANGRPFYLCYWASGNNIGITELHIINNYTDEIIFYASGNSYIRFNQKISAEFYQFDSDFDIIEHIEDHICSTTNAHNYGAGVIYTTFDIYKDLNKTEIKFEGVSVFSNPYIANTADNLATGTFDSLLIMPGDLDSDADLGVNIYKINSIQVDIDDDGVEESYESYENIYKKQLDTSFYYSVDDEFWYEIPFSQLGINFTEGTTYLIQLVNNVNKIYLDDTYLLYQEKRFTIGGLTEDDKEANRISALIDSNNKTTEAIKEQTETNKSILSKIGNILSYINPVSENFFGKKLVELIIDGLKSLFVPSDDFFRNWLDDLNQYFSDVFGILYYPFDLLVDFLNRFSNISGSEPIINIPEFKFEFMGFSAVLIKSFSYNFNDLLTNDTLKTIHDIYLTFVDIILWLGIVYLASNLLKHIIGTMSGEIIDDVSASEQSYNNYKQTQQNKARYSKEIRQEALAKYKK